MVNAGAKVTDVARTALLGLEWIFSLVIFSYLASRFRNITEINFLIAWSVIGWVIVTAMLVL